MNEAPNVRVPLDKMPAFLTAVGNFMVTHRGITTDQLAYLTWGFICPPTVVSAKGILKARIQDTRAKVGTVPENDLRAELTQISAAVESLANGLRYAQENFVPGPIADRTLEEIARG
jgi:hypothetical protein